MKKHLIDLQMFAEGGEPAQADPKPTEPQGTEPKDPAPTAKVDEPDKLKYSDADVNRILNGKFAEWQQKKERELTEAAKLAEMNAQEKAEYELKQEKESHAATQKELDEYKRKDSLAEMTKTARKMLADGGITIPDELLGLMVTTEADQTKAAVDNFAKLFKEAVESAVKDRLRGATPKVGTSTGGNPVSEIDKRINKYL